MECKKCGVVKQKEDFYKSNKSTCKKCIRKKQKSYHEKNPNVYKNWYAKNKEKIRVDQKKYYNNNKGKYYELNKKFRKKNPDKVREYQMKYYYEGNGKSLSIERQKSDRYKNYEKEYHKSRRSQDKEFNVVQKIRVRYRTYCKKFKLEVSSVSVAYLESLLGVSILEFINYLESENGDILKNSMSLKSYPENKEEIDKKFHHSNFYLNL